MRILAIDPGNKDSAYVVMRSDYTIEHGLKLSNDMMLKTVKDICSVWGARMTVVIEMVASYGMAVGKEVFDTCVWIGRFTQAALDAGCPVEYVYRMEEKMAICHDSRAKDSNIRQALIDRFAKHDKKTGKGTKANPDVFYGFKADMWSAFACGTVWIDKRNEQRCQGEKHSIQETSTGD